MKYIKSKVSLVLIIFVMTLGFSNDTNLATVHAATTITVNKNDETTAKKIDKQLKKGKVVQLKVKGSKTSSKKLLKKIRNQVGEVNNCDVKFQYTASRSSGKYYMYSVSSENAKLYNYSIKFVQKLYKKMRNKKLDTKIGDVLEDEANYPDEKERKARILYDNLVLYLLAEFGYVDYERIYGETVQGDDYNPDIEWRNNPDAKVIGYDVTTTKTRLSGYELEGDVDLIIKNEMDASVHWTECKFDLLEVRSYAEFLAYVETQEGGLDELIEEFKFPEISTADRVIGSNKHFGRLSDAVKVYAVSEANYFYGSTLPGYGVQYTFREKPATTTKGSKAMKHLWKGTARGVCHEYALYECLLWEQLGITSYYNSDASWNHAWSVVKVKNSKGNTMWIPFDYGIVMNSSKSKYKTYIKGIKGAPSKQKWKEKDFN